MNSDTLYDAAVEKYGHVFVASYFTGLALFLLQEMPEDVKQSWIKIISDQFNVPEA